MKPPASPLPMPLIFCRLKLMLCLARLVERAAAQPSSCLQEDVSIQIEPCAANSRLCCTCCVQSLSASAYLDPHLFAYSKHISPIMGLRNSPAEPLRFRLARRYHRGSEQRGSETGSAASAGQLSAEQGDPGPAQPQRVTDLLQEHLHQHQHRRHEQQQDMPDILQLEPANPQSVMWGNEECVRRQLHLFHPTDPFVLTVVQTIAQPAVVSICYRS